MPVMVIHLLSPQNTNVSFLSLAIVKSTRLPDESICTSTVKSFPATPVSSAVTTILLFVPAGLRVADAATGVGGPDKSVPGADGADPDGAATTEAGELGADPDGAATTDAGELGADPDGAGMIVVGAVGIKKLVRSSGRATPAALPFGMAGEITQGTPRCSASLASFAIAAWGAASCHCGRAHR